MKYQLKTRQICLFFIAFLPITKIFTLPSLLSSFSKEDLWISALVNFSIDFFTLALLLIVRNRTDKDIFTILKDGLGERFSKSILFVFALFLILKAIIPISEQKDFIELTLYFSLPSIIYFLPFFIIAFYLSCKKLRVIGRTADLLWASSLLGIVFLFALSLTNTDFLAILPVGANGYKNILKGSYSSFNWFGDSLYFLFFLGNYKNEKHSNLKILLSYFASVLIVILFLIDFYGIFTSISFRQRFALTEIAKYSSVINNTGRFDYLSIMMILVSNFISLSLPLFFASKIFDHVFNIKKPFISPLIIVGLHLLIPLLFGQFYYSFEEISTNYLGLVFLFFSNLLPIATIFLTKRRKTYGTN